MGLRLGAPDSLAETTVVPRAPCRQNRRRHLQAGHSLPQGLAGKVRC